VIRDHLLEASIPGEHKHASTALAVDWTDAETFSRPQPPATQNVTPKREDKRRSNVKTFGSR
jgi:hypothetical protein